MFSNKVLPPSANWPCPGQFSKLPPRCPLPSKSQPSTDCDFLHPMGKKYMPIPKQNHRHHQRTSSENFIIEEQPSWLDDLLNEPETPATRGAHRRSSSDSVAYLNISGPFCDIQNISHLEFSRGDSSSLPLPVCLHIDMQRKAAHPPLGINSAMKLPDMDWKPSVNSCSYQNSAFDVRHNIMLAKYGPSCIQQDNECLIAATHEVEKFDEDDHRESFDRRESLFVESDASDADQCGQKLCFERKEECSHGMPIASDTDLRRKQHFTQRSRVRKLQYIAELEQNVSLLHAEGLDVASELAFLRKKHLILSLENKGLMQRINSIAQEKKIKDAQYELLCKEVEQLQEIYYNQQCESSQSQRCVNEITDASDHLDLNSDICQSTQTEKWTL
ncbi:uncharacterized protein At4g06598-like [Magnolia sinica]|uniref:uncharacterized protein At4g06598-like n=1 Tax=Magnolia sinica TaxID=86752 RepID=UPI00265A6790|nr:uncharacterized protein At4g06598-like [Magnolia sinica]XP_058105662.1 uncharacterized protein At4g06598-like [Magnolia sinica]XP_058105663.1 uncharacterized protein At4g06598-like [Magnolia sinica]